MQPKYAANWCVAATTSLRPTRYAISSLTVKESWKWITVRCSCPMTFTRWRKKRSGSTTPRHRPTSSRLTSISSTALGRCSRFRSRSIMIVMRIKTFSLMLINIQQNFVGCSFMPTFTYQIKTDIL